MTYVMPTFNFDGPDLTEADIEELSKSQNKPKFFEVGKQDLKIKEAVYHKQSEKDPNWHVFKLVFGNDTDERTQSHYIMVPFGSAIFADNKKTGLFMYSRFRDFAYALGIEKCNPGAKDLSKVVQALFSKPEKLVGKEVSLEIGYEKHYVRRVGKDEYRIFEKNGKDFMPNGDDLGTFPDADSAIAEATSHLGFAPVKFASIIKFYPSKPKSGENPFED